MDRWSFVCSYDLETEYRKVALARILGGSIAFVRVLQMYVSSHQFFDTVLPSYLLLSMLTLLALYTVGFCTPIITVLLLFLYVPLDLYLDSYTLGTYVLTGLFLITLFTSAGSRLSVDQWLRIRLGWLDDLYSKLGEPCWEDLRGTYFLAFTAFALISFSSVSGHLLDPYWQSGDVLRIVFSNSFYSRFFTEFRALNESAPALYDFICWSGVLGQLFFQLFMYPLSFTRLGSLFVRVWGVIFFVLSFVLFQLSYLPLLELVLWSLFFGWRRTVSVDSGLQPQGEGFVVARLKSLYLGSMILFCVFCVAVGYLLISTQNQSKEFREIKSKVAIEFPAPLKALDFYLKMWGLYPPNVFNTPDVESGNHWAVVVRVAEDGAEALIPYIGWSGERLRYHDSDLIYYRNSIPLRRCLGRKEIACINYIYEIVKFDFKSNEDRQFKSYKVYFYEQPSASNAKLILGEQAKLISHRLIKKPAH